MSEKLIRLAERRATLIARAENQRDTLGRAANQWRKPLAFADQGVSALHYLKQHPGLLAGSALVLALLRPRRVGKWAQRGWLAWRITRSIRRKLYG